MEVIILLGFVILLTNIQVPFDFKFIKLEVKVSGGFSLAKGNECLETFKGNKGNWRLIRCGSVTMQNIELSKFQF